jgi:hypothetical protein
MREINLELSELEAQSVAPGTKRSYRRIKKLLATDLAMDMRHCIDAARMNRLFVTADISFIKNLRPWVSKHGVRIVAVRPVA